MSGEEPELMLHGRGGRDKKGRPGFGASVMRLYNNDDVWRGAVDLLFIGLLIMGLVWGLPEFFSGLYKYMPWGAQSQQETVTAVAPDVQNAQNAQGANFSTAPADAAAKTAKDVLPKPRRISGHVDRDWIGDISDEERKELDDLADMSVRDPQQGISLLSEKAEGGDPNAQYLMGVCHINIGATRKSEEFIAKGVYWYKEAAGQDNPSAQFQLGQIYRLEPPGIRLDIDQAIKWYESAAENPLNKSGAAENELGRLYMASPYVRKDYQKAHDYFEAGARKGHAGAEANLGAAFYNGHPKRDFKQALYWTQKAAEDGSAMGQVNLALFYLRGKVDGKPDYGQFLKWAGLAADQGDVAGMMELGNFYREGKPGFPVDQKMAARYFRLAALKKDPKAQFNLAQMYEQGLGLPQDKIQAFVYYNLSYRAGGFAPAYESIERMKKSMSASELEYAEKMSQALTDNVK